MDGSIKLKLGRCSEYLMFIKVVSIQFKKSNFKFQVFVDCFNYYLLQNSIYRFDYLLLTNEPLLCFHSY